VIDHHDLQIAMCLAKRALHRLIEKFRLCGTSGTVAAVYYLRLRTIALALRVFKAAHYRACASRTAGDPQIVELSATPYSPRLCEEGNALHPYVTVITKSST